MAISQTDLIHALDNSTPYPVELSADVLTYMAEKLSGFCLIERNEESELWQPEEPPEETPEPHPPVIEIPGGSPTPEPERFSS